MSTRRAAVVPVNQRPAMTTDEAAGYLCINVNAVCDLIRKGDIQAFQNEPGGKWTVERASCDAYIQRRAREDTARRLGLPVEEPRMTVMASRNGGLTK